MNKFLELPSTDFQRVRDGRNSLPLWLDIDLSVSRSIIGTGANAALSLNIAGNSFYVDQDTLNVGNATVHFQDTNLGAASAPLFVSAGFIANVPFTQMLIENTAQPGKRLRIFYGVDIDFQAGINASISISGNVGLSGYNNGVMLASAKSYSNSYQSITAMAAYTPDTVFAPGANANGAIVLRCGIQSCSASGATAGAFVAKTSAPASFVDGDLLVATKGIVSVGANWLSAVQSEIPIYVPPGKGLYYMASYAETAGYLHRHCQFYFL